MAYTYGNTQNAAERIKEISGVNPLKMYEMRQMLRNLSCI